MVESTTGKKLLKDALGEELYHKTSQVSELGVAATVTAGLRNPDYYVKNNQAAHFEQIGTSTSKPNQVHHYATDKNKIYIQKFKNITDKYGLDLDADWNKDLLPHQGRHPNEYHDFVLEGMRNIDNIANGNQSRHDIFKLLERDKGVRECFINYHLIWTWLINL